MVETWRDSWFEEGARVFYIVPRGAVDSAVPLTVNPAPAETVRVFVGRVELMTLRTEWALDAALASSDVTTLNKYSRFLDVFVNELRRRGKANVLSPAARAVLEKLLAKNGTGIQVPKLCGLVELRRKISGSHVPSGLTQHHRRSGLGPRTGFSQEALSIHPIAGDGHQRKGQAADHP